MPTRAVARQKTNDERRKQDSIRGARVRLSSLLHSFVLRLASCVCFGLLVFWLTLLPAQTQRVDVGSDTSDLAYVRGAYQRETAADTTFRWVSGTATLTLPTGQVGTTLLEARLHGAPDLRGGTLPLTLTLATGQVLRFAVPEGERVYRFPLPTSGDGVIHAQIDGATVVAPGDNRAIAFALDRVAARPIDGTAWVPWPLVAAQGVLLGATLALLLALRVPDRWLFGAGALLVAALAALNLWSRLWIATAALPLALATAGLAALTVWVQPRVAHAFAVAGRGVPLQKSASREDVAGWAGRLLWAIVAGGAALRLFGVLVPGFEAHDLDIQSLQFGQVATGLLYFTVHSHEWAGAATFYPPGPYVLLMPLLTMLPSLTMALQVGTALADAAGPLLLALIARQLGASQRTALLAALLLAALPIQFTALWWGFFTNTIGQALVLLLVWALLAYQAAPTRRGLALVGLVAALVLLSHAGVLAMAGVLVVVMMALGGIDERRMTKGKGNERSAARSSLARLTIVLLGVGLAVGLLYFSVIVFPMIVEALTIADTRSERDPARSAAFRAYIIDIQPVKWWRGLVGVPALVLIPGLALMWQQARGSLGRALLVAWPLVPLLFFVADVIFLVQARYVYFAAPVCVLATAVFIGRIPPSRAGRIVVWAIVALIVISGCLLWLDGTLLGDKPSLVPLSH